MRGAFSKGVIVKYSADTGIGVIRPFLHGATTSDISDISMEAMRLAHCIFFTVESVCSTTCGNTQLAFTSPVCKTTIPVIPLGSTILFTLQPWPFTSYYRSLCSNVQLWAQTVSMCETPCFGSAMQRIHSSEWWRWREERQQLESYLAEDLQDHLNVSDDQLKLLTGIPVDI
ncbi:hypothetical protein ERJ75_001181900 [Trypanosoma vivax]|uniref:Uncharacterized protein n=1 Tax=Trypanosoma vivax (strain Y486) TaxID=1055687 RepID=G0UC32_TRYVY|nr:hypothetical protein TRVL_05195 [Trypanosoma vivax]KAH8609649.1 hypothetical protein ERJ75_001181900 [Trypanosoma vivax]CCC53380.1 conserved hypothetical protein [Trypanosoma vivax Y486]